MVQGITDVVDFPALAQSTQHADRVAGKDAPTPYRPILRQCGPAGGTVPGHVSGLALSGRVSSGFHLSPYGQSGCALGYRARPYPLRSGPLLDVASRNDVLRPVDRRGNGVAYRHAALIDHVYSRPIDDRAVPFGPQRRRQSVNPVLYALTRDTFELSHEASPPNPVFQLE